MQGTGNFLLQVLLVTDPNDPICAFKDLAVKAPVCHVAAEGKNSHSDVLGLSYGF